MSYNPSIGIIRQASDVVASIGRIYLAGQLKQLANGMEAALKAEPKGTDKAATAFDESTDQSWDEGFREGFLEYRHAAGKNAELKAAAEVSAHAQQEYAQGFKIGYANNRRWQGEMDGAKAAHDEMADDSGGRVVPVDEELSRGAGL